MPHLVLLGDSIFDNAAYVPGGPSVIEQLNKALPKDWRATLLATDGAVIESVARQLARLPAGATHLVVSVGGNDALGHAGLIRYEPAASFAEVLARLGEVRHAFASEYRAMLRDLLAAGKPLAVCTIYDAVPGLTAAEQTGLALFNEVILREAFRAGVDLIDLRLVCADSSDYARSSPIEPSVAGGGKIARALCRAVTATNATSGQCSRVFT